MAQRFDRRRFLSHATAATLAGGAMASSLAAPTILRAADDDKWGDLVGRFSYEGDPPERKKFEVDKDVECCGKFDLRDESLMVGDDHGLANTFVYVRSRGVDVCPELEEAVEKRLLLDNRDCIFIPHCMGIWHTKQEYHIVNSDPVGQNVAFKPFGDTEANIIIPVDGEATWKFNRAQRVPVTIKCNYHKWESAYIAVCDHPYFAVSAADGTFRIPKLPVGEIEFQAWHERIGYLDTPEWRKGRFEMIIKPGTNDLGTVKLKPEMFEQT